MNPVPIGVPGELLIGGDGLARGYKNLPEMTADRFIPDKFSKNPNDRLYKTGDVVRFTSDGKLECIGRKDHQVKIRGFRIELGEIESLINMEQSVKEGIVVAKELVPGEKSLVAYIIPASDDIDTEKIRGKLKEKLPHYMVPSFFMTMESFPMTPNGKIDRKALPLPQRKTAKATESFAADVNNVEGQVKEIWKEVLNLDDLDVNGNFFDLGGHSLLMAQVRSRIKNRLNKDVSMMDLFKYPTVASLAAYLSGNSTKDNGNEYRKSGSQHTSKIAIIGMSGRFPGAKNLKEFWDNLCGGVNSITRFTEEEVIEAGVSPETVKKSGYVKAWGTLEDIDLFDAQFFGYNPREAEVLDPQQRIFLEESWKAIEDAGYDTEKFKGSVGVFGSVGRNSYAKNLESGNDSKGLANDYQIMISNDKDFLATRIGYKLNLEGPCLSVQTACSSSLVALHLACRSLINGECDMALAGGVSIRIPQKTGYLYQEGMILSPDGDCRAFDDDSKGTVGGNGAGVVVLKRYEDAVADGDNISAVILGSAINNDGAMKIGYTAPRVDGQAKAIAKAQEAAGIDPESVTYIEAHGTGTPLGDPIEIEALTSAFRKGTDKKDFCAIGSVKTNIGHLDAAAGVAGLIKTVLALRSRMLPPSLNFKSPNKKIDFKESPFFVNNSLNEWKNGNKPLRAGVSAFGIGGTNAHVVLEEAPEIISDAAQNKPMLFVISAKNKKALDNISANLAEFFESNRNINLADAAYTLQMGRREFEHRRFFIASTVDEAIELLKDADKHSDKVFDSADGKIGGISQTIDKPEEKTLDEIGRLWLNGASVNWADLYTGQRRKRVSLPTYPFEGRSFWVKKSVQPSLQAPALKNKKNDVAEWFYSPIWKQSVENREDVDSDISKGILLVLKDSGEFSDAFEAGLRERGANIISAVSGSEYKQTCDGKFTFDPENPEHYEKLIGEIAKTGKTPVRIANMLGLEKTENRLYFGERLFFSMMYTAQAIGKNGELPVEMRAITGNTQRIFNETQLNPENALHLGACRVISTEYGNIKCCSVDLNLVGDENNQELADLLIDELYFMPCDGTVAYRGLERWKQDYEKMPLKENGRGIKFKDGGVYVITGGMGGIGLITAQNISHEVPNAKLVLVGRSGFPGQSEWDSWLNSHGRRDHTSQKILKMKELISAGAEVFTVKADVTQKDQVDIMRKTIIDRFGRVDGIIHAAGRPGGGMIQMKKKEQAEEVLKPKVYGAINLYEVFKDSDIDFMIFYSSLNAITGGFGQIDYSAANAFMDAFAQAHDSRRGTRYISVDWDRWPGTGMAVSASQGSETQEEVHPLLGRCILDNDEKTVYSSLMSPEKDWVLSEHLVLGTPTIAGTTYLEMARAAYEDITGNSRAVISNVLFLNPLAVKEGEKRDVFTVMTKNGNAYNFAIISKGSEKQKDNADWTEHIHGTIAPGEGESKDSFRIDDLKQKCSLKNIYSEFGSQSISEKFISFGGRWRSLKNYSVSDSEGLVEVQLNDSFAGDMENFKMHPSILDVATGALRLTAKGNYLPFSYGKLEIFDTLPAKIYGYIRFKSGFDTAAEIITSDIDILSESGEQLIKITNFSMKLVSEASAEHIKNRNGAAHENSAVTEYVINILNSREGGFLQEGIAVPEGLKAMRIIMKGCFKPQVIVSTKDIDYAIEQSNYIAQPNFKSTMLEAAAAKARHPRPEVESEYVPPKKDIEKKLVNIWEDVLSIDKVGIHDDFFALGGDSLLLIQLHSTLKENFETDFAVVDLYKYNTVALLAKYLSGGNAEDEQPAFEEVNSRVNKQRELMKKRRQNMMRRKGVNFNE
ncbi:MAG TPA: SDR family NAD(P)-dependent oxidoreductase, partial [Ruminiclostridium sp.]|nr:SDR family NAD(P)-dependent oxidoreductase [Ruminiclostridium sp.]